MNRNESFDAFIDRTTRQAAERILGDPKSGLALDTISKLSSAGYIAYLAGGCVRDALLGRIPKDYDVATSATPEQIRNLFGFRRTLAIGAAFGVVSRLGSPGERQDPVEVATFRSDGNYSDGRRPDAVVYSSPELDAQRRDFTINGLFFDPQQQRVIDLVDGRRDLWDRVIRAIGDPNARFAEDKLRLMRAVRFAATFGFQLEERTLEAINQHAAEVTICSGERIGAEMRRILGHQSAPAGLQMLIETRLGAAIMPSVASKLSEQGVLAKCVELLERCNDDSFETRLSLILASPDFTGQWFPASASGAMDELVSLWRLSNDERDAIAIALQDGARLLTADKLTWAELQPLLVGRFAKTSVAVAKSIAAYLDNQAAVQRLNQALDLPSDLLDPPPLISGNDLIKLGLKPGPHFRILLQDIRHAQLNGEIASYVDAVNWLQEHADVAIEP